MFEMGIDVWPPQAPTNVAAEPGTGRLHLNWTASTFPDIRRYDFYCDPPRGVSMPVEPGTFVDCWSDAFAPGGLPDTSHDPYRCGTVSGREASSGDVEGLSNETSYVVSVVGVDTLSNVGVFSSPMCPTPHAGADPPPRPRDDSLCSISRVDPRASWLDAAWLAMALGALGRRRSRRLSAPHSAP